MRFPTSKRGEGRRAHSRRKFALGAAVCLLALAACLAACAPSTAPQPTDTNAAMAETGESDGGDADASTTGSFSTAADFTDVSTGMFPDIQRNAEFQNAGNRGCAACHDDLLTLDKNNGSFVHITNQVGMKKGSYNGDCVVCHYQKMGTAGNIMSENLHVRHYSSPEFVNANGNCWSCHAMDSAGAQGDYQFMLWDDFYDSPALGGYPNIANDETTRYWLSVRGKDSSDAIGFNNRMDTEQNPTISVSFAQDVTDHEDVFIVNNWGPEVTEKNGEPFSFDAVCSEENTVSLTGVKNPRSFTKAELLAMPQTEFTMALACATNGRGGSLVSNIPMSGVSVAYLIEQCGGLPDGVNAVNG